MNTKTKEAQRRLFNTVEMARSIDLTRDLGYPFNFTSDKYGMIEIQEPSYYPPSSCVECDLFKY